MCRRLVTLIGLLWMLSGFAVHAQENPQLVRARVLQLALDAPPLQAFVNGEAFGEPIEPDAWGPEYMTIDAGTYTLGLAPEGKTEADSIVGTVDIDAQAGHDYTLAVVGTVEAANTKLLVIDETAALGDADPAANTLLIFVHNLKGAPSATVLFDDQPIVENLAYGSYTSAVVPVGAVNSIQVVDAADSDTVLMQPPFVPLPMDANITWMMAMVGSYPGTPPQDYRLEAIPTFKGTPTLTDGGALNIGTPAEGTLATGERIQFTLTLDSDETLNLTLTAADSPLDSYLRVYDASGDLVAENDEMSDDDDTLDAGLEGLALSAGTYTLEAASYGDSSGGAFVLTAEAAP